MKKIIIASKNKHKIKEISTIINNYDKSLKIININNKILENYIANENGKTFEENSIIKAIAMYNFINEHKLLISNDLNDVYIIADDSGLEVEAMQNKPGIYSGRYADTDNPLKLDKIDKLLYEMKVITNRKAKFLCAITILSIKTLKIKRYIGKVYGKISKNRTNIQNAFDYDVIFIPNGYKKTFSELSIKEKNKISHRNNAIKKSILDINNW